MVDADDRLAARIDAGLRAGRRFFDAQLRQAVLDGAGHAAHRLDLFMWSPGPPGQLVGEPLDVDSCHPTDR